MKKILVVAINYECEDETYNYAKGFENFTNKEDILLWIVDNKSSKNSKLEEMLKNIKCDVFYSKPNENLGYLNGCLYGIEQFRKKFDYLPDWVAISNTDIVYPDNNFYEKFLANDYDKDIWCVGPSVLDSSGVYSNPHYKSRLPIEHVNRVIYMFSSPLKAKIYLFLAKLKSKFVKKKAKKEDSQYVYSNHGCFFILKKDFIEKLGDEKYGVLLYSEESFIAEFILENNKKSYYDSSIEVIHNANLVTGKVNIARKAKFFYDSMSYIKRRFYENK